MHTYISHRNRVLGTSPLSLLLQCLSAYDLSVSALSLLCFSAPVLDLALHGAHARYALQVHARLLPYAFAALHMAITGSDYLNLAAAVERYIALDGPFRRRKPTDHARAGCTPRVTWIYIVGIFAVTVAFNLPMAWERCAEVEEGDAALAVAVVRHTTLRINPLYVKLYRLTLEFLVFKATPWFAFFILFLSLKERYYLPNSFYRSIFL